MNGRSNVKYLHLVDDEKTITDVLIGSFEDCAPGQNAYLLAQRVDREIADVRQKHLLTIRRAGSREYLSFARSLPSLQAVFVHFLTEAKVPLVAGVPDHVARVWLAWGADFYERCWSPRRLYQPLTYAFVRQTQGRIDAQLRYWSRRALHRIVPWKDSFRSAARLFDYCGTIVPPEYDILKRQTGLRARQVALNYGDMRTILGNFVSARAAGDAILVGNSSTPASNHADIFRQLANSRLGRRQVVVPLSYGDEGAYLDFVKKQGQYYLGAQFEPFTRFVPPKEYVDLLARCSTCVFNHERQQGLGNVLIAIWLGARVFLRPTSPVFGHLSRLGVRLFPIDERFSESLEHAALDEADVARNRAILDCEYGEQTVAARTRDLLRVQRRE